MDICWTNEILSENVENITDINENGGNFVSGPIECSVCHPTNNNIMFVGTVNGNIWKTENAQSNNMKWYVVNELSQTTITSIIYDTSDSNNNTMYASTGNKTSFNMGSNLGGIYKSTNGGNTWTFINIDNTKKVNGDTTIDDIQPGMLSLSGVEASGSIIVVTSDTENYGGVFAEVKMVDKIGLSRL